MSDRPRLILLAAGLTFSGSLLFAQTPDAAPPGAPPSTPPAIPQPAGGTSPAFQGYTIKQKFIYNTKYTFYPIPLMAVAAGAGISQWSNTPKEWGQGAEGYRDRFGSTFGTNFVHQYMGFALQAALHEDPRYFLSQDRSFKGRVKSVIKQIVVTKTDSGGETFAVGRVASALGAGFVTNVWMPKSNNGIGDGFLRGIEILGVDAGVNLSLEFIPFVRRFHK